MMITKRRRLRRGIWVRCKRRRTYDSLPGITVAELETRLYYACIAPHALPEGYLPIPVAFRVKANMVGLRAYIKESFGFKVVYLSKEGALKFLREHTHVYQ